MLSMRRDGPVRPLFRTLITDFGARPRAHDAVFGVNDESADEADLAVRRPTSSHAASLWPLPLRLLDDTGRVLLQCNDSNVGCLTRGERDDLGPARGVLAPNLIGVVARFRMYL
jgi:hypothetical protein